MGRHGRGDSIRNMLLHARPYKIMGPVGPPLYIVQLMGGLYK